MLIAKNNLREAGHIAAELLDSDLELESKCETIERTVTGGIFSLEKALKLYGVTIDAYIDYLATRHAVSYYGQLAEDSKVKELSVRLKAMEKLMRAMFGNMIDHEDLVSLMRSYGNFSKRVIRKQELVK
ncbi:MAG TPA: hypothetical protein VG367_03575 [Mucilaginibacter sp.]|jgi:predicted HTH domain antitoxin|nr:hypothetical protein [Mucilaginibacter sp.]